MILQFYTESNACDLGVISMHFSVFLKVKEHNGDIFWVPKISNSFLGCLKFLISFLGER